MQEVKECWVGLVYYEPVAKLHMYGKLKEANMADFVLSYDKILVRFIEWYQSIALEIYQILPVWFRDSRYFDSFYTENGYFIQSSVFDMDRLEEMTQVLKDYNYTLYYIEPSIDLHFRNKYQADHAFDFLNRHLLSPYAREKLSFEKKTEKELNHEMLTGGKTKKDAIYSRLSKINGQYCIHSEKRIKTARIVRRFILDSCKNQIPNDKNFMPRFDHLLECDLSRYWFLQLSKYRYKTLNPEKMLLHFRPSWLTMLSKFPEPTEKDSIDMFERGFQSNVRDMLFYFKQERRKGNPFFQITDYQLNSYLKDAKKPRWLTELIQNLGSE